ncbi:MAG: nucleoside hydrolase [Pirellulales bacterium]|nr:nucleoside hydrolase [Pirellulales bacterium]
MRIVALTCALAAALAATSAAQTPRVPVLYSTDLFHPHNDPDDHYDLATLFALDELDIRGIVFDLGDDPVERTGIPAVEQLMEITGKRVPFAPGIGRKLASRDDKAPDAPPESLGAVELILDTLRESKEKVAIIVVGSCRDVAVAFNREPELFRSKVKALYLNVGRGPADPKQDEWNVGLDPLAYYRLFESGLPLVWCPCFGKDGYQALYVFQQPDVIPALPKPVQNYFVYCLTKSTADPIAFLATGPHPTPQGPRNMWSTASFFHAAGRKIHERAPGDFVVLPPEVAEKQGLSEKRVEVYTFEPIRAGLRDGDNQAGLPLAVEVNPPAPNGFVFRATDERYGRAMTSCLKNLLAGLGQKAAE